MPTVGGTHDIRIGANYYLIQPGSYMKRAAPLFGARFSSGDPDYNNLNFWQHWAQTCWVGGFGAPSWQDDAMYDEGVGVDTSQHEVMLLSRDLGPATRGTWTLGGYHAIKKFSNFGGVLYCLVANYSPGRLYRFNHPGNAWGGASDTWTLVKTFTESIAWMEPFAGALVFGDTGTTLNKMTQTSTGVLTFTTFAKPSGRTEVVYMMKQYRSKLYVGIGRFIYRLKKDFTWDGSTFFYEADDINYINQMEVHLGFLYMVSRNGHILRTDGNNTFDLWQFEGHAVIWGIRSFDGRLFIGTAEEIEGTSSAQTVIYQFSGAAVTELKRWGKVGYDTTPGKFYDIDRSLFFGASNLLGFGSKDGFGIARYDPAEDAFHLFATNQDAVAYPPGTEGVNNRVDDICYYRGYMFCTSRQWGVFRTAWTYRDATRLLSTYDTTPAGAVAGSKNGGWYESSDFDGGTPGLRKLWNAITVHVDIPTAACSAYVEVSKDGGGVWYSAGGSVAAATIGYLAGQPRRSVTIILQDTDGGDVNGWFSTRLKYRITLRTTDTTRSPQLRGVIVRYLPVPEPQWLWDFNIILSERQQLHDGTFEERDLDALVEDLQAKFRNQELVEFQDVDGTIWSASGQAGALMHDFQMRMPYVGPTPDGQREVEIRLQLMEAVNLY